MTGSAAARWLTRLALRHPLRVVASGVVVAVLGILLASRLSLQTDLSELLPAKAPSVIALHELSRRVGGTGNVAIAIEAPEGPAPLRAYMPLLANALRTSLGSELLSVRYSRKELFDYFRRFAAYYVSLDELEKWSKQLSAAISKQNPAYIELDDDAGDPLHRLADEVRSARAKLKPRGSDNQEKTDDPETGIFLAEGGHVSVIFVRPASSALNLAGGASMMDRIKATVASTQPAAHGVRILGYTGSIPVSLAEVAAIRHDIISTAMFVILGVGAIVMLFFGGIRELMLMSGAVIIGTAVALGFAELWIGHVNAQTAFLGAIIVGTGINYGLIFLDRYRQQRVAKVPFEVALEEACAQTLRATLLAAVATAVSFGVLAAGEVESFHQFGWIGGIGILASWIATFTVVPACIVLADRHRDHHFRAGIRGARGFAHLAALCERWPRPIAGAAIALAVVGGGIAAHARHDAIETNLRKLGTRSADSSGIEHLDKRLRPMDDRSATPAVIATDDRNETAQLCDVLNKRARTDLKGIMRRCYSMADVFPRDLDRRQPLLAQIRANVDAIDDEDVAPEDRPDLAELRRALAERPPTDADLPHDLSEYFIERDGSIGKLAFVEPNNEHIEANLYKFSDAIRSVRLPSGKVIKSSGELVVFADVLRAMRRDALKLTLAAAILVLLVLAVVSRHAGTFVRVGGALVAGVAVMLGVAVVLGEKLNFFNFVALPTTFGIGIDYAINIEERIRQRGRAHLRAAVTESAPAVALASSTSMIGYASLVPADSRALASFGALAIIGELTCVVLAIVLVPALWAARSPKMERTGLTSAVGNDA